MVVYVTVMSVICELHELTEMVKTREERILYTSRSLQRSIYITNTSDPKSILPHTSGGFTLLAVALLSKDDRRRACVLEHCVDYMGPVC